MGRPRSKFRCPECGKNCVSATLLGAHRWSVHKVPGKSSNSRRELEKRRVRLGQEAPPPVKRGRPRSVPTPRALERVNVGLADAIASLRMHVSAYQDVIRMLQELSGQDQEELSRG